MVSEATLVVNAALGDEAKHRGFRKSGTSLWRRWGETIQVLEFQSSLEHASPRYYINVGIAFDALWRLVGQQPIDRPKSWQCHFSRRLEQLIVDSPAWWEASGPAMASTIGKQMSTYLLALLASLDRVTSPAEFVKLPWLSSGADHELRAQLLYSQGDLPGAMNSLRHAAALFADRPNCSVAAYIRRCKLVQLEPLMERDERTAKG